MKISEDKKLLKDEIKKLPERKQYELLMDLVSVTTPDVRCWITTNLWQMNDVIEDDHEAFEALTKKFHG